MNIILQDQIDDAPIRFTTPIPFSVIRLYFNHFHNILRLFDVLPNFPFTTSETMRDYYFKYGMCDSQDLPILANWETFKPHRMIGQRPDLPPTKIKISSILVKIFGKTAIKLLPQSAIFRESQCHHQISHNRLQPHMPAAPLQPPIAHSAPRPRAAQCPAPR